MLFDCLEADTAASVIVRYLINSQRKAQLWLFLTVNYTMISLSEWHLKKQVVSIWCFTSQTKATVAWEHSQTSLTCLSTLDIIWSGAAAAASRQSPWTGVEWSGGGNINVRPWNCLVEPVARTLLLPTTRDLQSPEYCFRFEPEVIS